MISLGSAHGTGEDMGVLASPIFFPAPVIPKELLYKSCKRAGLYC